MGYRNDIEILLLVDWANGKVDGGSNNTAIRTLNFSGPSLGFRIIL